MKQKKRRNVTENNEKTGFLALLKKIYQSRFTPLFWILLTVVIVLLDILFAGNNLHTFAIILGVEIILVAIIGWTKYLIGRIRREREE